MADGTREFRLRQRHETPARIPFPLSPALQRMFDRGQAMLGAPFTGLTADGAPERGLFRLEPTGHSLEPVIAAARAFLAALDPAQRNDARFPLDSPMWQGWSNVHCFLMRHGVCLDGSTDEQRERGLDLLRASLSAQGFQTARDVMRLNGHVLEITGRAKEYGEWLYWISIFGEPSSSEPWGWQIDGHHLIVNCFVLGDQMALTPMFMGSEPLKATSGKYAGASVFEDEERDGYGLMQALSPEQRTRATIGMTLPTDAGITSGFHDNDVIPYQGLRHGDMSAEQRERLLRLASLYIGRTRAGHAEVSYAELKRHLERSWFAWIGPCDEASPFYYRIHSPVVLIEFDHQSGIVFDNDEPTRNHIHTIVRTPNGNDYGKDLLRLHYARHDHGDPASPHRRGKE